MIYDTLEIAVVARVLCDVPAFDPRCLGPVCGGLGRPNVQVGLFYLLR